MLGTFCIIRGEILLILFTRENIIMTGGLTISQFAKKAEVKVATIRYYERCGMMVSSNRTPSGYRLYSSTDYERLRFIKKAQTMGFTLKEIVELLSLQAGTNTDTATIKAITREKVVSIEKELTILKTIKGRLLQLYKCCPGRGTEKCPILEELSQTK